VGRHQARSFPAHAPENACPIKSRRRTPGGIAFTRDDLWAQSFRNQIGEALPKTASTQPLSALPATFTYAQARHAGLSKHTLYRLREGGRVAALSRGLYRQVGAEPADTDLIAIAAYDTPQPPSTWSPRTAMPP